MKTTFTYLPALIGMVTALQFIQPGACTAQTASLKLKPAPANVAIDGSLSEWGDSLTYYNTESMVNYTLSNDKDNLYLVLKTNDPEQQHKILNSGVTLAIDAKDRKKATYTVTFPVQEDQEKLSGSSSADQEKRLEAGLTKLRKLKVDGFKDVEYDLITLENTYGFKAAIDYDAHGFLIYEEAIPLSLFHADDLKKGEWTFNIKINGHQKAAATDADGNTKDAASSGGGGGRGGHSRGGGGGGGMGGGGGRGGHNHGTGADDANPEEREASKSVDFWGKFYLWQG
jgi:hypothetical protein